MMDSQDAEKLLALPDGQLAEIGNRWKGWDPKVFVISPSGTTYTEEPEDWARGFMEAWSSPKNAESMLSDLGVEVVGQGPRHNRTDGESDLILRHSSGDTFRLNDNYYKNDMYVKALRWALGKVCA